jgi:UDP-glucose 4-epimerase
MSGELFWVIGARGLLGSAVVRHLQARPDAQVMTAAIPWHDEQLAIEAFRRGVGDLAAHAAGGPWRVLWCAGTGVPATPQDVLDAELRVLGALLDALADHLATGNPPLSRAGVVFLASSAGAVYGGSAAPPFDEHTEPVPLSHYGWAKLAQEQIVRDFSTRTGISTLIGRISNLYGPGQNLGKAQGIISHLCRAHLTGQPASIYVSMDTIRDYIYVDDCAAKITDGLRLMGAGQLGGPSLTKILAAQQGTTLAAVLGYCQRVFKRRPRVVLGSSVLSSVQAHDLRLRSVVAPEIDCRPLTPMVAGVNATHTDLALALQRGALVSR